MANPSKYRVGPPPSAVASPSAAIGGILVFIGLWLLFMGVSEYYGGASTQNMYRGTVLERDADANRIVGNAMSGGVTKIGFGLVALLVGGVVAAAGKKSAAIDVSAAPSAQTERSQSKVEQILISAGILAVPSTQTARSRSKLEQILIGVGIFFALLMGIPLLLFIFGVIK